MPPLRTVFVAALAVLPAACDGREPAPHPEGLSGVLLISIDTLRADHLSAYGYEPPNAPQERTSPCIDRLVAAQGLRFERAYSTTSWTLPAHMTMLTGLPNELHGVRDVSDQLHGSRTLLPETFAKAGWRTAGFWSGPNLHPWFGFDRGWELYEDCSDVAVEDATVFTEEQRARDVHSRSHDAVTSPALLAAFERWLDGVDDDEPFFAFVHMWDVHYDYNAPPRYDVFFPDYDGEPVSGDLGSVTKRPANMELYMARLRSLYDAEIRFTDEHVGKMLERLERDGRLDETLVIVTSDHGEEFYEHNRFGHRQSLYEEVVHVPLLMRLPGRIPAGETSDALVGLVDLAPTILEYCDLAPPADIWGRSLRPVIEGAELPLRAQPLELTAENLGIEQRGVHFGRTKILMSGRAANVFDLETDPDEQNPLTNDRGAPSDKRVQAARLFLRTIDELAEGRERITGNERPADLNEGLEATGYLGENDDANDDANDVRDDEGDGVEGDDDGHGVERDDEPR